MSLFWRTGNNYGREAAAFLKRSLYYGQLGTIAENEYGREAAVFLLDNWELRPRSGRFLELGNWHQ